MFDCELSEGQKRLVFFQALCTDLFGRRRGRKEIVMIAHYLGMETMPLDKESIVKGQGDQRTGDSGRCQVLSCCEWALPADLPVLIGREPYSNYFLNTHFPNLSFKDYT